MKRMTRRGLSVATGALTVTLALTMQSVVVPVLAEETGDSTTPVVDVQDAMIQTTYPDLVQGGIGDPLTVTPKFVTDGGQDASVPQGASFKLGDNAPENAKVDANTGVVSYSYSPKDPFGPVQIPVVATYAGQDHKVEAVVVIKQDAPTYNEPTSFIGDTVELPVTNGVIFPQGTKFNVNDPALGQAIGTADAGGKLKVQIPASATPGEKYPFQVKITYPNTTVQTVDVKINVVKQAEAYTVTYQPVSAERGTTATLVEPTFTKDGAKVAVPDLTSFKLGDTAPAGSNVDAQTGAVTWAIPADAEAGKGVAIPVVVSYGDSTSATVNATVTPTSATVDNPTPQWDEASGLIGDTVELPVANGVTFPAGTTFAVNDIATKKTIGKADEKGTLMVTIPSTAQVDSDLALQVMVTYPGNDTKAVNVTIKVGSYNTTYKVAYDTTTVKAGESFTLSPTFTKAGATVDLPKGTKFLRNQDTPADVTLDSATGMLSGTNAQADLRIPVDVQYPDNTAVTVYGSVEVTPVAPEPAPVWQDATVDQPGGSVTVTPTGTIPAGLTVAAESAVPGVTAQIDPNTGAVTVTTTSETPAGTVAIVISDDMGKEVGRFTVEVMKKADQGNTTPAVNEKCLATGIGLGLGLAALSLAPLGLASQVVIPGAQEALNQVNNTIAMKNVELQKNLGIYSPEIQRWMADVRAVLESPQVRKAATYAEIVLIGLAAVGILWAACDTDTTTDNAADNTAHGADNTTGSATDATGTDAGSQAGGTGTGAVTADAAQQ